VSRKRFRLTVRAPRGVKVSKVVVRVNRKLRKRASARSGKAKLKLTLSRLPRGKLRVAVQVRGSDGRTYAASRTYRACR
jgi:hypothetical protein